VLVYSDELGTMKNIPEMTVALAIDDVKTHKTHILIVAFALYFGPKIKQSLICLNQCHVLQSFETQWKLDCSVVMHCLER
jgi:hypothetical protein